MEHETNENGHYALERVYSDPSAAHERATKFKNNGSYRVVIEPERGRFVVTAWFKSYEEALKGAES
ncbi:MAG: hypothetical protein GWO28_15580 [candidate division Zixibacteria bacterium]|nr:hypothetical protein [candidate division Zixibacteria bacterium]